MAKKKALLIAEKPSLKRAIMEIYEQHKDEIPYDITFMEQAGHLLRLKMPEEINEAYKEWSLDNIPFTIEDLGGWQYTPIDGEKKGNFMTAKERLSAIMKEYKRGGYDFIIHAGDPDMEGEILVWETLDYMKCRIPVFRFWTNDLNEKHVVNALKDLRDEKTDDMLINLRHAGLCRQHSDYLTGLNMTRAATCRMVKPGTRMTINTGRVMTAILKIVVDRENEIRNFKPVTVYGVQSDYAKGFTGKLFSQKAVNEDSDSEDEKTGIVWFDRKKDAQELIDSLGDKGTVKNSSKKMVTTNPPKLFMLASAQVEAGRMGYKADRTLDIIQSLYEKKYVTYPRTDCEVLSSDDDFDGILSAVGSLDEYRKYVDMISDADIARVKKTKKWVDDKKMQKAGHSALRPTITAPKPGALSSDEQKIYDMICRRFISIFLPPLRQNETTIIVDIDGHDFISRGKTLVDRGYTVIYGTNFTDSEMPVVTKGEILDVDGYELTEKTSKCPSRFTSATMVAACESPQKYIVDEELKKITKELKIGTQATRASIINKLIHIGYIEEVKVQKSTFLKPSAVGEMIIGNLRGSMICRVDMTAEWEEKLEKVRSGDMPPEDFESDVRDSIIVMVEQIKESSDVRAIAGTSYGSEVLGACPICKTGQIKVSKTGYYCTNIRDKSCGFWVSNPCCGKKISEAQIKQIIEKGETGLIKGFVIEKTVDGVKKTKRIDAHLAVSDGRVRFRFDKPEESAKVKCPKCGKPMRMMPNMGWGCSGYPECRTAVWKIGERVVTEKELAQLLDGKEVVLRNLTSKKGNKYSARYAYRNGKTEFIEYVNDK